MREYRVVIQGPSTANEPIGAKYSHSSIEAAQQEAERSRAYWKACGPGYEDTKVWVEERQVAEWTKTRSPEDILVEIKDLALIRSKAVGTDYRLGRSDLAKEILDILGD